MKRVLITGITGFAGSHLASHLLSQQLYEIYGTYRSEAGLASFGDLKDRIQLEKVDLQNAGSVELVLSKIKPDYLIHLAAQASPAKSYAIPIETLTNNIISEFSVLDAIRKLHLLNTRVLIISTAEIYGLVTPADLPVDEETPFRPINPYAVSKLSQDYLSLQYHLAYKLDIIRVRPFNHIGPGQKEGYVVADFAKQIAQLEKDNGKTEISVGNLEGRRDFTDVRDMVKAYEFALLKGISGEVYNLGSGKTHKINDILTTLLSFSSKKITVSIDKSRYRPIDVPEIVCDCSKFQKLTGWEPEIQFEKSLQDILDYWRKIV